MFFLTFVLDDDIAERLYHLKKDSFPCDIKDRPVPRLPDFIVFGV